MKIFFLLILFLLIPGLCSANSVQLEPDNAQMTISLVTEKPVQVGAFDLLINYSGQDTNVENILGIDPFVIITDIDNAHGTLHVAGFAQKDSTASSKTRMASIQFTGRRSFELVIGDVVDQDVQRIPVDNVPPIAPEVTPQVSPASEPAYIPVPRYAPPPIELPLSTPGGPGPSAYQTQNPSTDRSAVIPTGTTRTSGSTPVIQETQRILPSQVPMETPLQQNQAEPAVSSAPQQQTSQQKTPISIGFTIIGLTIVFFIYQKRYL
jgi:hypothetical protein